MRSNKDKFYHKTYKAYIILAITIKFYKVVQNMLTSNPSIIKGEKYFLDNVPVYINLAVERKEAECNFHRHDFIEIAYVSTGRGTHIIGNDKYDVSKGDLCIINYDIPHVFIQNPEDKQGDFTVYNCVFKPEFIDYSLINSNDFKSITASLLFNTFFIEDTPAIALKLTGMNQTEIEEIYMKMYMEYTTKPKGYINILRSCLIEMLTKIFRLIEGEKEISTANSHKYEIINEALEFLNNNYSSSCLNIDEVAFKTFLSRGYFSKIFKEVTGINYSEYLQNLRITEACKLLKTSDAKIIDIMSNVGFKDIKHFHKLFKKITGHSPGEYRKINNNSL